MPSFDRASIQADYLSRLESISRELPLHLRLQLDKPMQQLEVLFADNYPMVINHWDLVENNIHVDEQTGRITGIVDWRDATVGPFGTQFWGLDVIIGIRRSKGMEFHPEHLQLRRLFWQTLHDRIGPDFENLHDTLVLARVVGTILANGEDIALFEGQAKQRALAVLESVIDNAHS